MTLRRLLFWSHLIAGLVIGLVVFCLAVTGCILSFQQQILNWAERGDRVHSQSNEPCLLPSQILKATADAAGQVPFSWTSFRDATKPTEITFSSGTVFLVDPCSGKVIDSRAGRLRSFFLAVRDLHRYVAWQGVRHETLRSIKNACVLGFVFLTVSGIVLWFPRKLTWKHIRVAIVPRWNGPGRASEWSLHTVFGFWLCIPLFFISSTGLIMGYLWANNLLYRVSGDPIPSIRPERTTEAAALPAARYPGLDPLIARASKQDPNWQSLLLRMPPAKGKDVAFTLDAGDGRDPRTKSQLLLARKTGDVVRWDRFYDNVRGRRWRLYARFIHTGELFGVPGQAIAFCSALAAVLLVVTGFSLSIRRFIAWRARRQRIPRTKIADQPRVPVT